MERESVFYFEYWQNKYDSLLYQRQIVESNLKKELNKYSRIFEYYDKSALVYLSISVTKNGRGFNGINSYFSAITPFPKTENDFDNTFFTLLHEFTHQFTDDLLKTNINMIDGSHDISENIVIVADYYLIKSIDCFAVEKYLNWLAKKSGNENFELNELNFFELFKISDSLDSNLKNLINGIKEINKK